LYVFDLIELVRISVYYNYQVFQSLLAWRY